MKKAVVTLTRGYSNLDSYNMIVERNNCVENNLDKLCDSIIFHEGNILKYQKEYIQNCTNIPIKFIEIPKFLPKENIVFTPKSGGHGWGYRHMCSFWFVDFWKYVQEYDMILRIDEDCLFNSNIDYVFQTLEDKVCVYGKWHPDNEEVTEGLNDFSLEFFGTERGKKEPSGPYTNVLGLNLKKMRENKKLFEYINKVDELNKIFIHRWGDLPLWGEVLYYLYSSEDYCKMDNIKYYHISHNEKVNF
jgi:hypothetical protein